MTLGERIKLRRKELGMSADDLAEKLNVSRSTIFRYEKGDIEKIPADSLVLICSALGTNIMDLMGLDVILPSGKEIVISDLEDDENLETLSDEELSLIHLFRLVPEEDRQMIIGMIRAALNSKGLL